MGYQSQTYGSCLSSSSALRQMSCSPACCSLLLTRARGDDVGVTGRMRYSHHEASIQLVLPRGFSVVQTNHSLQHSWSAKRAIPALCIEFMVTSLELHAKQDEPPAGGGAAAKDSSKTPEPTDDSACNGVSGLNLTQLEGLPVRVPAAILCGQRDALSRDPHCHTSVPLSHVTPVSGWGSDPHAPILWKGRYHLFHQSRPGTCQWFWGMRWDHLVSNDLVTWARLPPALMPTPGWLDADGCFTGNIQIHPATGVPMLFYTGARLRHKQSSSWPEPPLDARHDLMLHWETQLCAVADPDDDLLVKWTKVDMPWMGLPPCAWLTSWRDPFFVPPELHTDTGRPAVPPVASRAGDSNTAHTQPSTDDPDTREHMLLIGSGLEGVGGTALIYRSKDLAAGWHFDGYLCTWPNLDTGLCWECPHLLCLPDLPPGLSCMAGVTTTPDALSRADQQLKAAVDVVWQQLGAQPADTVRCVPMTHVKPSSTETSVTPTPPLVPSASDSLATGLSPLIEEVLQGTPAVLGASDAADEDLYATGPPRTPTPGSTSLHAALTLNRQASAGCGQQESAQQTLTELLQDESAFRLRTRKESASATATVTANVSDMDATCVLTPLAVLSKENLDQQVASSAQDTLIQTIQRGRQEAVAALQAEEITVPVTRRVTPTSLDVSVLSDELSLCDVKAAQEASLGGLGYAGVLSHCAPHDAAVQTLVESETILSKPAPPFFAPGTATRAERHAACRAYALASAKVQGYDLNMPAADSDVVRRCKEGPTSAPEPARPDQRWFFGVAPDAATYGILYFLGTYKNNKFDMEQSAGPFKLDLGNTLYAPVAYYDEQNARHLVWGYLKELTVLPPPSMSNKYISSGCVSLPRALYLRDGLLHQVPLPEMIRLRSGDPWLVRSHIVTPGAPLVFPADIESQADIELTLRRGTSSSFTLIFHSWRPNNEGALALRFSWDTQLLEVLHLTPSSSVRHPTDLYVFNDVEGEHSIVTEPDGAVYEAFIDPRVPPVPDMNPDVPDWIRMKPAEAGGYLRNSSEQVSLRVFLDASALEVFTGCGQALSTRVYRGWAQHDGEPKVQMISTGGDVVVQDLAAYKLKAAWLRGGVDAPLSPPVNRESLQQWLGSFAAQ